MKTIPGMIRSYRNGELDNCSVDIVRSGEGQLVNSYSDLIAKLAHIAFGNPGLVLLFRGQRKEYLENDRSTLYPTMYRNPVGGFAYPQELDKRYKELKSRENRLRWFLKEQYPEQDRVSRSELSRWAILQHYEVCPTPLLDVTQSSLVACSFAQSHENEVDHSYLYVLGIPQIGGSITVAPLDALQVVRLSGVCPPDAIRPYIQEGYLTGTYPSVDTHDEKLDYRREEMDCAQRIIAKFKIPRNAGFWDNGFVPIPQENLLPEETSDLAEFLAGLREEPFHE